SLEPYGKRMMWGPDGLFPAGPENGRLQHLCQQATETADSIAGGEVNVRPGLTGLAAGTPESHLLEVTLRQWQHDTVVGAVLMFQDASAKQRLREQIRKTDPRAFPGGPAAQFPPQVPPRPPRPPGL